MRVIIEFIILFDIMSTLFCAYPIPLHMQKPATILGQRAFNLFFYRALTAKKQAAKISDQLI